VKVLVHAHTSYSWDGTLSPARVAEEARRRGFAAVLVADHFESLDPERFSRLVEDCRMATAATIVPGIERSWDGYHVCAFGLFEWVVADDLATWSDAVREAGGIVSVAHPVRYRHRIPRHVLDAADALEVWNAKRPYDGTVGPHPRAFDLLDGRLVPLAAQDAHRRRDFNSVGIVIADVTGPDAILREIRAGRLHLASRLVSLRGAPGLPLSRALRAVHAARPVAWAIPVRAYRVWRRVSGRPAPVRPSSPVASAAGAGGGSVGDAGHRLDPNAAQVAQADRIPDDLLERPEQPARIAGDVERVGPQVEDPPARRAPEADLGLQDPGPEGHGPT
jgi:hypothetical protein